MGCPASGCRGYEIGTGAGEDGHRPSTWAWPPTTDGDGWVPIPEFTAIFEGNGNTISNLKRFNAHRRGISDFGLFHTIGRTGVVRNLAFHQRDIHRPEQMSASWRGTTTA